MGPSVNGSMDVIAFIKSNCQSILGAPFWEPRFICRAEVGWKAEKLEPRILVISKFRVFFLSCRALNKIQVESTYHLLSMNGLEIASLNEARVTLDSKRLYVNIESAVNSHQLVCEILTAFKHYFPDAEPRQFINLLPHSLYDDYAHLPGSLPAFACGSFRRTYAAVCDFHKLPFREEVVWDVEKIYATHDCRSLRLDEFDHLAVRDLVPIVSALQFNRWFRELCVENKASSIKLSGELLDAVVNVLRYNGCLERLVLLSCGLKSDFLNLLAQALTANPGASLRFLNLAGVMAFAQAISALRQGLVELDLSSCSLTSKAVNAFAVSCAKQPLVVSSLKALRLCNNPLRDELSELSDFLSHTTQLEHLDLSGTGAPMEKLFNALAHGGLNLKSLKLTGCTYSHKKVKDIAHALAFIKNFLCSVRCLNELDMSECVVPADVLKAIVLGLTVNEVNPRCVDLNLSQVCADKSFIPVFENSLSGLGVVSSLSLRDNGFGDDMTVILCAVGKMPILRRLDIGGNNFLTAKPKQLSGILVELVKLINDDEKALEELVLTNCKLGADLSHILNSLGICSHLTLLDITGNAIRDTGVRLLGKALQINSSLRTLHYDRNHVTCVGYTDLANALEQNYTLVEAPYPIWDVMDAITKEAKDKEKTEAVLRRIEALLSRNRRARQIQGILNTSNTLAHAKMIYGNMEEELRKQAYLGQKLLSEGSVDAQSDDAKMLQAYLADANKTEELILVLQTQCSNSDFVDNISTQASRSMEAAFTERLRKNVDRMLDELKPLRTYQDEAFLDSMRQICNTKLTHLELDSMCSDLNTSLRNHYGAINFWLATQLAEGTVQELISQLTVLNRRLGAHGRLNSTASDSAPSSDRKISSDTPKQKQRFKLFKGRNARPKSTTFDSSSDVVDNISDYGDPDRNMSGNQTPRSTSSADLMDRFPEEDSEITGENLKLRHLQKDRPKRAKNHASSGAAVGGRKLSETGGTTDETLTPASKLPQHLNISNNHAVHSVEQASPEQLAVQAIDDAVASESIGSSFEASPERDVNTEIVVEAVPAELAGVVDQPTQKSSVGIAPKKPLLPPGAKPLLVSTEDLSKARDKQVKRLLNNPKVPPNTPASPTDASPPMSPRKSTEYSLDISAQNLSPMDHRERNRTPSGVSVQSASSTGSVPHVPLLEISPPSQDTARNTIASPPTVADVGAATLLQEVLESIPPPPAAVVRPIETESLQRHEVDSGLLTTTPDTGTEQLLTPVGNGAPHPFTTSTPRMPPPINRSLKPSRGASEVSTSFLSITDDGNTDTSALSDTPAKEEPKRPSRPPKPPTPTPKDERQPAEGHYQAPAAVKPARPPPMKPSFTPKPVAPAQKPIIEMRDKNDLGSEATGGDKVAVRKSVFEMSKVFDGNSTAAGPKPFIPPRHKKKAMGSEGNESP